MSERRPKKTLEQLGDNEVPIVIDPSEFDETSGTDIPDMPVIPRDRDTAEIPTISTEIPTKKNTRATAPGIPAVIMNESTPKAEPQTKKTTPQPSTFAPDTSRTIISRTAQKTSVPPDPEKITAESVEAPRHEIFAQARNWEDGTVPVEDRPVQQTITAARQADARLKQIERDKAIVKQLEASGHTIDAYFNGSHPDSIQEKMEHQDPPSTLYEQFLESVQHGEPTTHDPIIHTLLDKWNNEEIDITSENQFLDLYNTAQQEQLSTAPENEGSKNIFTPAPQADGYTTITPNFPNIPPRQQILQRTTPEKPPSQFWKKFVTRVGALAATLAVAFGIYKANDTHENTPVQTTEASPDAHPTIEELSPTQARTAIESTQQVLEEVIDEGSSRQSSDEVVHRIVERIAQNNTPEGRIPEEQIEPVIASTQPSIEELISALQPERITVIAQQLESIVTHVRETLEPLITPTQAKPETISQTTQTPIKLRIGRGESVWSTLDRFGQMDIRRPDNTSLWNNPSEFHTWRMNELRRLGYEQRGDQWGHPFTTHEGAEVQLSFDASGTPYAELLDPTKNTNPTVVHHSEPHFNTTVATTEHSDATEKNTNTTEKQEESQKKEPTDYTDVDVNGTKIHTGDTVQIVSKSGKPIQYTITKITSANGPKRLILRSLDGKTNTFKDIKKLEKGPLSFSLITKENR